MPTGVYERTPEIRAKISAAKLGISVPHPRNTPEHNVAISKAMRGKPQTIEHRAALRDRDRMMIGGHDIVQHHYIYDDSDKSRYTMPMIRSKHQSLHIQLRKQGYIIPCITGETRT